MQHHPWTKTSLIESYDSESRGYESAESTDMGAPRLPESGDQSGCSRTKPCGNGCAVVPYNHPKRLGRLHIVDVEYLDNWRHPESELLPWEVEATAPGLGKTSLPSVDAHRPDSPDSCEPSSTPTAGPG